MYSPIITYYYKELLSNDTSNSVITVSGLTTIADGDYVYSTSKQINKEANLSTLCGEVTVF